MTDIIDNRGHVVLPFGVFYGAVGRRLHADGVDIALLNVDPYRVVERHSHEEAHFVFVLDGLYVSSAAGAPPVSSGLALIFNPAGTTHRDRFEARDRVMSGQFLTLSIASDLMDAGERPARNATPSAVALTSSRAFDVASRLVTESLAAHGDVSLQHESLALALLAEVSSRRSERTHGAPAWLAVVREHLDDSLGTNIRISDLARSAGVHPVHLARVFRRFTALTPGDYLRHRRLSHACTLLRQTRRPLAEVAMACGFVDPSHFTNTFRRAYGVAPGAYRRL